MADIHIDATCIGTRPSGARQRFVGIYSQLFKLRDMDRFSVYIAKDATFDDFPALPNLQWIQTPLPSEGRWPRFFAGLAYWQNHAASRADIFESLHLPVFFKRGRRQVLTIHDLRKTELERNPLVRWLFELVAYRSIRQSDAIIAVSAITEKAIRQIVADAPVTVIYNGIDMPSRLPVSQEAGDSLIKRINIQGDFLLSVGHLERRKRYDVLIRSACKLRDRGVQVSVVVVGNDSGERRALEALASDLGVSDFVRVLSGLSDDDVRLLYLRCAALVFPSEYEGFGIPILEAMAAEVPMVLSDIEVFKELTEGQVSYFRLNSSDSLADQIEHLLSNLEVGARQVAYGRARREDFTFASLSEQHSALYDRLLAQP